MWACLCCSLLSRQATRVVGFDTDAAKISALGAQQSGIHHIAQSRIQAAHSTGHMRLTTQMHHAAECAAISICVPTPLSHNREPDMRFVAGIAQALSPHLTTGQLIV